MHSEEEVLKVVFDFVDNFNLIRFPMFFSKEFYALISDTKEQHGEKITRRQSEKINAKIILLLI